MSKSVNKVILVGHLGKRPALEKMPSGDSVVNVSIATSKSWTDKNSGELVEATEWHQLAFFRGLADVAGEYLKKGSKVYIEGELKNSKWQDNNGNDRYSTSVVVKELVMLDAKPQTNQAVNHG
ncbi:MAG: single-stranded DNA-binding protein [Gammaproteobacteria bacterium]|nr:single-stranded DNA-binding protein [Gammaproteobacteria bacterium]